MLDGLKVTEILHFNNIHKKEQAFFILTKKSESSEALSAVGRALA